MFVGPNIAPSGLVFATDASSIRTISPTGNTAYNGAPSVVYNSVRPTDTVTTYNGLKLNNVSYYTAFAIDYPESSYGGAAASRDGITPGYNVTSGTKTFDFGRALNYAVFDNKTNSFVKIAVYDSYVGTAAVDTFVSEYYQMVGQYPGATHIVAGSHRDSNHTAAQYDILRDLGAPSNVNSIIGFSSPEWILVGEPGLGAGNAYGWSFQNYSTNPGQVAHMVFPLPLKGNKTAGFEFDGSNQYMSISPFNPPSFSGLTLSVVANMSSSSGGWSRFYDIGSGSSNNNLLLCRYSTTSNIFFGIYNSPSEAYTYGGTIPFNQTAHYVATADGANFKIYINGQLVHSAANSTIPIVASRSNGYIGRSNWADPYFNGTMYAMTVHNRGLSAQEVYQSYLGYKQRFGI